MLQLITRIRRVTHPAPESLIPFAHGADDPATARHVEGCATCQTEIERVREAAELLRGPALLEDRRETPECLDELVVAEFVEGRLGADARGPVVAHLLGCARCRALVKATAHVVSEMPAGSAGRARSWRLAVPLGAATAAVLLIVFTPRRGNDDSQLREPTVTSTVAPVPLTPAPGASVGRVDRLVWSSVPGADTYRLRLFDGDGSTVWMVETSDTSVALPDSVRLLPRVPYFWRVEAQADWLRWTASDLVSFRLVPSRP